MHSITTLDFRQDSTHHNYRLSAIDFYMYLADPDWDISNSDLNEEFGDWICNQLESGRSAVWGCTDANYKIFLTNDARNIKQSKESATFTMRTSGRIVFGDGGDLWHWRRSKDYFATSYLERNYQSIFS